MSDIGILIIDDDEASQAAIRQLLDSEGWRVSIAPLLSDAMRQLAEGEWKLVIANIAMTGLSGPLYATLRELALSQALEGGATRVRVLFLVPELAALQAQPVLESERLPYTLKPFHLHDFLDKVSDLLMETETIASPIRHVRQDGKGRRKERAPVQGIGRNTSMFASRGEYSMTEEEILEYEKQEAEAAVLKKKKKTSPLA